MDYQIGQDGNIGVLTLEGELTVESAEELKAILIRLLDTADEMLISLEKVAEADLSCLQLFCSAHRTSESRNKRLKLAENRSEAFERAIRDGGYSRCMGCHLDRDGSCLWVRKERDNGQNHYDGG